MALPKFSSEEQTEEKEMTSEGIPSTEFPEESEGRCTTEGTLQTGASGFSPEMEQPKFSSEEQTEEKEMTSEGIPSTEFPEESEGRCTTEGALQTGASGSPPEMEQPKSLSEEETEEKVMTSECIPSTEFPESEGKCTRESALQMDISGSTPEIELPKSSSEVETDEKIMTSEGIPCTDFSEESEGKSTRDGALQMSTSGSTPEIDLPKSSSEIETEKKVMMTSEEISSAEFAEESAERCTREDSLQSCTSQSPPDMELLTSSSLKKLSKR
ncbi:cilia- and flagella-associated protein 251-like [Thamnophis elegans]|nr:cilia- and flagella-associated protein 251-like [Thamnophis elegans]